MLELPAFAATPEGGHPMGQFVRLPGGITTLQDAADAFLDHHDLAHSNRRVYRASLASLVVGLGPAAAVVELSGPVLAGWFRGGYATAAPATWNRELATLRAAVGWWRRRHWPERLLRPQPRRRRAMCPAFCRQEDPHDHRAPEPLHGQPGPGAAAGAHVPTRTAVRRLARGRQPGPRPAVRLRARFVPGNEEGGDALAT
jgi:hypothetical protein